MRQGGKILDIQVFQKCYQTSWGLDLALYLALHLVSDLRMCKTKIMHNTYYRSSIMAFLTTASEFLETYMSKPDCSGKKSLESSTVTHGQSKPACKL